MSAIDNPFYTHQFHGGFQLLSIGRLGLEEGGVTPDCHLAVATFGELSPEKETMPSSSRPGTREATKPRVMPTSDPATPSIPASTSSSWSTRSAAACPRHRTMPRARTLQSRCRSFRAFVSATTWRRWNGCFANTSAFGASNSSSADPWAPNRLMSG
jgi:hypothetical protein